MFVLFKKMFVICPNVCPLIFLITQVIICDQKHLTWSRWYAYVIYVTARWFLFLLFRFLLCSVTSVGLFDCWSCFRRYSSCLAYIVCGRWVLKSDLWWWLISWLALRRYWTRKCCYKLNVSNWSFISACIHSWQFTGSPCISAFIFLTQYYVYAEKRYCCVKLDKQISFNHIVQMQVNEFRNDPEWKCSLKAPVPRIGRSTKSKAGAADVMDWVKRLYILISQQSSDFRESSFNMTRRGWRYWGGGGRFENF